MSKTWIGLAMALALAVAAGCDDAKDRGGHGGGSATVNGSIGGVGLDVKDQFAITTQQAENIGGSAGIFFGSVAGVCTSAVHGEQPSGVTALTLLVYKYDANA